MRDFTSVQCPYCGQEFELSLDTTVGAQCLTTDCEICCRPMEITLECADGDVVRLDIRAS